MVPFTDGRGHCPPGLEKRLGHVFRGQMKKSLDGSQGVAARRSVTRLREVNAPAPRAPGKYRALMVLRRARTRLCIPTE